MKGRVLAIDWGEKRIGLALSDALRMLAKPLQVLASRGPEADLEALAALVLEHEVTAVIVGLPVNDDGSMGPMARKVEAFAATLEARIHPPVILFDEGWSSVEAEDRLKAQGLDWRGRRGKVDALAAQVFLQSWLETQPG